MSKNQSFFISIKPSVNVDFRACHVPASVGSQESSDLANVLRLAKLAQWNLEQYHLLELQWKMPLRF